MCEWEHCEKIVGIRLLLNTDPSKTFKAAKPRISLAVLAGFEATENEQFPRFESILWAPNVLKLGHAIGCLPRGRVWTPVHVATLQQCRLV